MLDLIGALGKFGTLDRLLPVFSNVIDELGPAITIAGTDAVQIATDAAKLVNDLKAKVEALKGTVTTAALNVPKV